jgi:hypothetical protein
MTVGIVPGGVVGVTKVVDNGPDELQWNLVITGDGFTQAELGDFATLVDDFVAFMQTVPPFNTVLEWNMINVHRLDAWSAQSGADSPNCDGTEVVTYFNASYCPYGQEGLDLHTWIVSDAADDWIPEWDAVLVFVNHPERGGAASFDGGIGWCGLSDDKHLVAIHELGHAGFGLEDEYDSNADATETYDLASLGEPDRPNVTCQTWRSNIKWADLIDPNTPIPTTENTDCTQPDTQPNPEPDGTVGLYEGAANYRCGIYRPEYACRMRYHADPFCAVCSAAIVEHLWQVSMFEVEPSDCFVASAVYGDPRHPDVATLRSWRDERLAAGSPAMRLLAAAYTRIGPPLARLTAPRPRLARLLRATLIAPCARALRRRTRRSA